MCQPRRATGSLQTKYESRFCIKKLSRLHCVVFMGRDCLQHTVWLPVAAKYRLTRLFFSVLSLYCNCILLIPGCSEAVLVEVDITRSPPKCQIKYNVTRNVTKYNNSEMSSMELLRSC